MPQESEKAAVAPPQEKREKRRKRKPKRQPNWAVVLHNDELHTFPYVVECLMRVCGHNEQDALLRAQEAHNSGRSVVWTGPLEVAELKRDQIRGFGPDFYAEKTVRFPLGVSLEPVEDG